MSDLSIRAFDQAQRRKKYPERKGPLGVACMQRDILTAQKHLSILSEILWQTTIDPEYQKPIFYTNEARIQHTVNEYLARTGLQLLQLSGCLGIDFVTLMRQHLEKEELAVL